MSKVVVFGGSGFLGSYIVSELIERNSFDEIVVFDMSDLPATFKEGVSYIKGNILDEDSVNDIIKGADVVYNLAAMMDLQDCIQYPVDAVKFNTLGNTIILQACVNNGVKRFVFSSSVYAYNSVGGIYASTKRASEDIIKNYSKYYGMNYTILQYGTLYGTGSQKGNSIYKYLNSAIKNNVIEYVGDGTEVREYIHVIDAAKLSVDILDQQYENKTIIITGHHPTKVADLFRMIQEMIPSDIYIRYKTDTPVGKKDTHYKVTPYSHLKELPLKMTNNCYVDLGVGLLQLINYIELEKDKT